jgi:hypothetical protein
MSYDRAQNAQRQGSAFLRCRRWRPVASSSAAVVLDLKVHVQLAEGRQTGQVRQAPHRHPAHLEGTTPIQDIPAPPAAAAPAARTAAARRRQTGSARREGRPSSAARPGRSGTGQGRCVVKRKSRWGGREPAPATAETLLDGGNRQDRSPLARPRCPRGHGRAHRAAIFATSLLPGGRRPC